MSITVCICVCMMSANLFGLECHFESPHVTYMHRETRALVDLMKMAETQELRQRVQQNEFFRSACCFFGFRATVDILAGDSVQCNY